MEKVVAIQLNSLSDENLLAQLPTILLYDHTRQTYSTNINLLCTTKDENWSTKLLYQNGQLVFTVVSEDNAFRGQSGDMLNVAVLNNKGAREGSTFHITLSFDQGDANFDGNIDVLDLQTIINYAFEDYKTRPFNYTAANLWVDDVINVQDVVKMTDLLLAIDDVSGNRRMQKTYESQESLEDQASIYIKDGQVWIDTQIPVSAFEVTLHNVESLYFSSKLKELGFTCRSNSKNGITHLVGYSMDKSTLPIGKTSIASIQSSRENVQTSIGNVVLSDSDAEKISVRLIPDDATGINDISGRRDEESTMVLYDLQGRRVNPNVKKGLYILQKAEEHMQGKKGRKVMRK